MRAYNVNGTQQATAAERSDAGGRKNNVTVGRRRTFKNKRDH